MKNRLFTNFWSIFSGFVLWSFLSCQATPESNGKAATTKTKATRVYRTLNVRDFQAKGDGKSDDTKQIQQTIQAAQKGDTILVPEGTYLVKTLVLKSDIHLKGLGQFKQTLSNDTQRFSRTNQNSSAPLFFGRNLRNISLSFCATTTNEALYISKSTNIRLTKVEITGDDKKIYAFPGLLFYECDSIEIRNSRISNYGAPRQSAQKYQAGTGIRLLSCSNIRISDNTIQKNGENGIFMHGSGHATISDNHIAHNGMSAIQIGFGKTKREQQFQILNNTLSHNAADAIDINNKITEKPFSIYCIIKNNKSFNNGFVAGESTVDGSGLATLVNVSEVQLLQNSSRKSNRPALYLERCGAIQAENNNADNKVELVQTFGKIVLKNNTFDALTVLAGTKGRTLQLEDNKLRTLLLPNGIAIDSLIMSRNVLSNASLNINMQGHLILEENQVLSQQPTGAILLVKINSASLTNNHITSTAGSAITVKRMATSVHIEHNTIQSVNACVVDEGSPKLALLSNELMSIKGGRLNRTLVSYNPNDLQLKGNTHKGGKTDNSIRLEGVGHAYISQEKIVSGYPDYGKVVIKKL
ncbi:right-handed parallel beta-helix repeat-containing protein [Olivibacter sp. XZL3]|uniref:right-handed parallel beta-helix repeat-containing protein n=1 Tax=Olivibacter sp. XZL3 TaxID=1735116 RepID=UPI001065C916|nr:right-handed parallel beta-helix repeat-containing protein [Olivibacter sp. XZL3]